nr:hypothetical protein [Tanacetum cinerariifolium]
ISQKEFCNNHKGLLSKEIEGLEALDYVEFNTLREGRAFLTLEQFCYVSFRHNDRNFTSQAWNRLFGIREQVVRVYVLELLSSFKFRDHVVELDIDDTMVFQLLGTRRTKGYKKKSMIVGAHLIGRIARSYRLMSTGYMRIVTLGPKTLLLSVAKLVDLGICRYNGLGLGELVDDQLDNSGDEAAVSKARRA